MHNKVVLGLDGGGTYTRVAITDMEGNLLSYIKRKGAASIYKDADAARHTHSAIYEAVEKAGCGFGDIAALTAGVAGLDGESDMEWAQKLVSIEELGCTPQYVNDAVIAQRGAFLSKPGIIAISGTGSIVFAINESGRQICNYDFHHYAATAARCLSYDTVYSVIAGETDHTDGALVEKVLAYFGPADIPALTKMGIGGFVAEDQARNKWFGEFAPAVTEAAERGSRLAMGVCERAAEALATGIRLIGACFASDTVQVALLGGVNGSTYMKKKIVALLSGENNKRYVVAEPVLPAALGAVLMAMAHSGMKLDTPVLDHLRRSAEEIANIGRS